MADLRDDSEQYLETVQEQLTLDAPNLLVWSREAILRNKDAPVPDFSELLTRKELREVELDQKQMLQGKRIPGLALVSHGDYQDQTLPARNMSDLIEVLEAGTTNVAGRNQDAEPPPIALPDSKGDHPSGAQRHAELLLLLRGLSRDPRGLRGGYSVWIHPKDEELLHSQGRKK